MRFWAASLAALLLVAGSAGAQYDFVTLPAVWGEPVVEEGGSCEPVPGRCTYGWIAANDVPAANIGGNLTALTDACTGGSWTWEGTPTVGETDRVYVHLNNTRLYSPGNIPTPVTEAVIEVVWRPTSSLTQQIIAAVGKDNPNAQRIWMLATGEIRARVPTFTLSTGVNSVLDTWVTTRLSTRVGRGSSLSINEVGASVNSANPSGTWTPSDDTRFIVGGEYNFSDFVGDVASARIWVNPSTAVYDAYLHAVHCWDTP